MKQGKSVTQGYMRLAAAIIASGYKEKDKRFLEGDCKWWHDELKEGVSSWLHDRNIESDVLG